MWQNLWILDNQAHGDSLLRFFETLQLLRREWVSLEWQITDTQYGLTLQVWGATGAQWSVLYGMAHAFRSGMAFARVECKAAVEASLDERLEALRARLAAQGVGKVVVDDILAKEMRD